MMFKNVKKMACMTLAMILSVALMLPTAANAVCASSEKLLPFENSVFSFTGKQSSTRLSNRIESYGVQVKDDTLFQVVTSASGKNILMVTNINGNEVSQDVFMVLDEEGDVISMPVPGEGQSRGINDGLGFDMDDIFADGSFNFRWAILYDKEIVGGSYYARPKHAQFVCLYSASAGYTVYDAQMIFNVTGWECDSNFQTIGSSGPDNLYEHDIIVQQAVVARNTYYSRTNPYDANRWIQYNSLLGDFFVSVEFELDGRLYFDSWTLEGAY